LIRERPLLAGKRPTPRAVYDPHPERVFTYEGKPIAWANTLGWRKALKRAGLADFRWHDLRHTWASWHVQNGTPLHVLQEMGAWETASMVRRYVHLAPAHLAPHAAVVDRVLEGTSAAQEAKKKGLRNRNPLFDLVGGARFELATNGLKVRCSTN